MGYRYAELEKMMALYNPANLEDGPNIVDGEEIFFVSNPGLGLWAHAGRFEQAEEQLSSLREVIS